MYPLRIIKSFWKFELSMDAQTPIKISHPTIPRNGFECWQTLVEAWPRLQRLEADEIAARTPPSLQFSILVADSVSYAFEINRNQEIQSKTCILSTISEMFDPSGFLAPAALLPKSMLLGTWKTGSKWGENWWLRLKRHGPNEIERWVQ